MYVIAVLSNVELSTFAFYQEVVQVLNGIPDSNIDIPDSAKDVLQY